MTPRDWWWSWERGYGPLTFTLRFERSPAEWFASRPGNPYRPDGANRWRDHSHQRAPLVMANENTLAILQSYTEPEPSFRRFDAWMLGELLGGALGPFAWDQVDEDYGHAVAAGEDAASLQRHLTGDAEQLREHYRAMFVPVEINARHAKTEADALAAALVAVDRWKESRGPTERPRVFHLTLPEGMSTVWTTALDPLSLWITRC